MKTIKVLLVGLGSVGKGVAGVMADRKGNFIDRGIQFKFIGICDSKGAVVDENGLDLAATLKMKSEGKLNHNGQSTLDAVKKLDYDILVEVTPTDAKTGEPGLTYIREALQRGKNVVTSNKGPLAIAYKELNEMAHKNHAMFQYEATVGGAMPMFNLVRGSLAGNRINNIKGIFNGTCNYILTRMANEEMPYDMVLSEAKELGIAETDPTYDVEGIDTALKIVILANAVFGMDVKLNDVDICGISSVSLESLKLASDAGMVIKLIGEVNPNGGERILKVAPRLVPKDHPLAVQGTLNAALIQTQLAGDIVIVGKGAGSIETASAILSDMLYIASVIK